MIIADLATKEDLRTALAHQTVIFGCMLIGAVTLLLAAVPLVV